MELPQLALEKVDFDDYLQEGWLGLIPPMNWLVQIAFNGDSHERTWVDGLEATDPIGTFPSGITTQNAGWPEPAQAPQWEYGFRKKDSEFSVYERFVATEELPDDVSPEDVQLQARVASKKELGKKPGHEISPYSIAGETYPPIALFGTLPTIHPDAHHTAEPNVKQFVGDGSPSAEVSVPDDAYDDAVGGGDWRDLTGDRQSQQQPADQIPDIGRLMDKYGRLEPIGDGPLAQFVECFVVEEDPPIRASRDDNLWVRKETLKDAYNNWMEINREIIGKERIKKYSFERNAMEPLNMVQLGQRLSGAVDTDLEKGRVRISGERVRIWYGIELADLGRELANLK